MLANTIERLRKRIDSEFEPQDLRDYLHTRLRMMTHGMARLPEHMQEGALSYVMEGIKPGGFLTAVLENNLVRSYERADWVNTASMGEWAQWLYNSCPMPAWGGEHEVKDWIGKGGLIGRMKAGARE